MCRQFGTMVKFVVDVEHGLVALGGEMHADAEALLLQQGSTQSGLWGGNLYPWNEPDQRIEYTSFINIRPMDENMGMEIGNADIRLAVQRLIEAYILAPGERMEPLQ